MNTVKTDRTPYFEVLAVLSVDSRCPHGKNNQVGPCPRSVTNILTDHLPLPLGSSSKLP